MCPSAVGRTEAVSFPWAGTPHGRGPRRRQRGIISVGVIVCRSTERERSTCTAGRRRGPARSVGSGRTGGSVAELGVMLVGRLRLPFGAEGQHALGHGEFEVVIGVDPGEFGAQCVRPFRHGLLDADVVDPGDTWQARLDPAEQVGELRGSAGQPFNHSAHLVLLCWGSFPSGVRRRCHGGHGPPSPRQGPVGPWQLGAAWTHPTTRAALPASRRAAGTRNGEQET